MLEGYGTRRVAPGPAQSGGRQNENAQLRTVGRLILVAWTGIEPVTRGFSTHVALKDPIFMRVAKVFCVT